MTPTQRTLPPPAAAGKSRRGVCERGDSAGDRLDCGASGAMVEAHVRIAVTGATGVLGQEAVAALVAEGHEVTGVTRRERGIPVIRGRGAEAVVADVFDASGLEKVFRGQDVVIN